VARKLQEEEDRIIAQKIMDEMNEHDDGYIGNVNTNPNNMRNRPRRSDESETTNYNDVQQNEEIYYDNNYQQGFNNLQDYNRNFNIRPNPNDNDENNATAVQNRGNPYHRRNNMNNTRYIRDPYVLLNLLQRTFGGQFQEENYEDPNLSYEFLTSLQNVPQPTKNLDEIPVFQWEQTHKDNENLQKECAICLGDFELEEQLKRLPCLHIFHNGCVNTWLKSNNICPICKAKVDE